MNHREKVHAWFEIIKKHRTGFLAFCGSFGWLNYTVGSGSPRVRAPYSPTAYSNGILRKKCLISKVSASYNIRRPDHPVPKRRKAFVSDSRQRVVGKAWLVIERLGIRLLNLSDRLGRINLSSLLGLYSWIDVFLRMRSANIFRCTKNWSM